MDESKAIVQSLDIGWFHQQPVSVSMLRLDLLHPVISGNKYFKLKYNLEAARQESFCCLLTFGGPYSNHLIATAAMAAQQGFQSVGIVRGVHHASKLTHTLQQCRAYGMELHFISGEVYKRKADAGYLQLLGQQFPKTFIIPEGGANAPGRQGAGDIAKLIPQDITHVCISVGSGTTLAGLCEALPKNIRLVGFAPMKGGRYLEQDIAAVLSPAANKNYEITDRYHFGGFGKITPVLTHFMQEFEAHCGIPLDRVYTGKMMFGIRAMLEQRVFAEGDKILCIHTGGLQGNG